MKQNKLYFLILCSMFLVLSKIICNPLFFRNIEIHSELLSYSHKITASAITYPFIFVFMDIIVLLSNRSTAILITLFATLCDGVFSYFITIISTTVSGTNSPLEVFGSQMWMLFAHGAIASIAASVSEIILFAFVSYRIKNFFVSSFLSMSIMLIIHNVITDYSIMSNDIDRFKVIWNNSCTELSIMLLYLCLSLLVTQFIRLRYVFKVKNGKFIR